jgi:NAD(P)-dependent dehydrogenase (short-subunit alcohol dehydrogenase family)
MPTILITGASRGLGLEFTKQYAAAGWRIHASCRDPDTADGLGAVAAGASGAVTVHRLDVADGDRVAAFAHGLRDEPLDVLLNNAGIYGGKNKTFGDTDYAIWLETLNVNLLGPMRVAEAFVGQVARSGRRLIVCISSRMGSMAANTDGASYVYRSSKAGLNAVVRSLAADLRGQGITVVCFHPGWVATDMGGPQAPLSPADSVTGMRAVIERLTPADSGSFLNYDGEEVPW